MDEGRTPVRQHVEALVPRPRLRPELHLLVADATDALGFRLQLGKEVWYVRKSAEGRRKDTARRAAGAA
eukprot:Skav212579  [mRNA]  locus=scaffold125:344559:346339:+ [translate_table: standard]